MVIDTVLDSTGDFAENYAEQETVTLIERYAVSPKKKIAFSVLVVEGAPFTLAFSGLTETAGQDETYTDAEKRSPGSCEQMWDYICYDLMKLLEKQQ